MLGDITKCAPYTLETLIYNAVGERARETNDKAHTWMMAGLIVRVALQIE